MADKSVFTRLKEKLNTWKTNFKHNIQKVKPFSKYLTTEFAPYIVGYGIITNIPTYYFADLQLTPVSILAHGLLFYLIKEELFGEILDDFSSILKVEVNN